MFESVNVAVRRTAAQALVAPCCLSKCFFSETMCRRSKLEENRRFIHSNAFLVLMLSYSGRLVGIVER
jgi:hypothetical protein